jgi:hypothetical protein
VEVDKDRIIVAASVSIWIVLLLITTVDISHNTPANTLEGQRLNQIQVVDLCGGDPLLLPGLTYGTIGERIYTQISTNLRSSSTFLIATVLSGLLIGVAVDRARVWKRADSNGKLTLSKSAPVITAIGYIVLVFTTLHVTPQIHYQSCIGREPVLENVFNIPLAFWGLILAQAVAIGLVSAVLSTDIIPDGAVATWELSRIDSREGLSSNQVTNVDKERLRIHVQNWRQYGTWLISLFISVGLAGSLVFITDVAPFGRSFIIHAVVLFGGALALVVGFISYKISRLERHF